jgi:hypothetical protein
MDTVTPDQKEKTPAVETAASQQTPEVKAPVEMTSNHDAPIYRYFRAGKDDFEDENTFQVKMSSEFPAEQRATAEHERLGIAKQGEKYVEILSHEEGDVDLSRFTGENRAALLDEHNDNRHLGFIKTAALSKDKATRGVVTFDKVAKLSVTRCKQVRAGSRPNFSIGYSHTRYLGTRPLDDGRTGHVFAWQGLELSNVAVPADPTAQKGRSKNTECHCIRCGDIFGRKELNDNFMCPDCADAETPAEDDSERKSGERMFRSKSKDGKEFRVSHNDLKQKTVRALDNDKRFKYKRDNGDMVSDFYHHDNHQVSADGTDFQAIVSSPAWRDGSKLFAVDFTYDGNDVALGEATQVEPKTTLEAVDRGLPFDAKTFRAVDFPKLSNAENNPQCNLTKTIMAKNIAELETEAPALVAEVRTAEKTATRKAVLDEVHQSAEKRSGKIAAQLTELRTLADAHCKDSGKNWAGPDGAVVVVADEIRKLERSAYDAITALNDENTFNSEAAIIRNKFKTDAGELVRNSYAPREMREAGTLAADLSEKVSLKRMWDKANEAFEKGDRRKCFMLSDGAEFEADKELRNISGKYPGGLGYSPEGQLFPLNARGHISSSLKRTLREVDARRAGGEYMTRDSLLSDFPTLGALVPPEYMTPIELLRNKLVLVGNGLMEVHGVVGNPLTFPRLSAPTQAQSLAEGVALATYDQTFDQVKLTPHRVGTAQKYSRLGMSQAPGFEAVVWDDHARTAALYINRGLINGSGGGDDVLGILNAVGIGGLPFGGSAANAWKNIFGPGGLVTLIRKANIDDDITLLSTSVGAGTLRTTAAAVVGATAYGVGPLAAILQGDEIGGKAFEESQQIPADILLAVAARHVILATWAGLNVVLDTVQFADQDKFRLVTNQYYDVGLRHSQAVARSTDSITALA